MTRYIELAISRDGSHTHTDWRKAPVPDWGDWSDAMPTLRRFGTSRQFSGRFRFTEPATLTITAMEIEAE